MFVRSRGAIDVHIVPAITTASGPLISLCGRSFTVDDDLEHLTSASGAPCVPCLLRSLWVAGSGRVLPGHRPRFTIDRVSARWKIGRSHRPGPRSGAAATTRHRR
ncbi:hypothetical protein BKA25_002161 [Actinoalloteichus hymeniacidonis]|nr:hypothetical protein [Actinoalloteichus hymeniacidonis]